MKKSGEQSSPEIMVVPCTKGVRNYLRYTFVPRGHLVEPAPKLRGIVYWRAVEASLVKELVSGVKNDIPIDQAIARIVLYRQGLMTEWVNHRPIGSFLSQWPMFLRSALFAALDPPRRGAVQWFMAEVSRLTKQLNRGWLDTSDLERAAGDR